jgi:hypothetical protein
MNRVSTVFMLSLLASACAHQSAPATKDPTGSAVALASKKGNTRTTKVCETEMQVGSHFPITVCRTQEERDQERERTQQALRNAPQCTNNGETCIGGLDSATHR